jgi:hypothetical protein
MRPTQQRKGSSWCVHVNIAAPKRGIERAIMTADNALAGMIREDLVRRALRDHLKY